jgi:hypothetical protein
MEARARPAAQGPGHRKSAGKAHVNFRTKVLTNQLPTCKPKAPATGLSHMGTAGLLLGKKTAAHSINPSALPKS